MILKVMVVWFALLLVAILNGTLREMLITPRLGAYAGHFVSTVTLCAAIALVMWIAIDWVGPATATEAWAVGVTWLGLTVAFEFLGGHYLFGNSWERLLVDYNIVRGRVWILVLLTTLVAPRLAAGWQGILRQ